MKLSNEAKVGALVLGTGVLALAFAWTLGLGNPFKQTVDYYVTYNFAGGIEIGSPVRVSGIKVGKVEKIEFFVPVDPKLTAISEPGSDLYKSADDTQAIAPVRLKISVRKDAAVGVRKDSRFYITPGHQNSPTIHAEETVAGIDPPRIDQLISQSFDLAGKIKDLVDENKGDITKSIELLYKMSGNINKTLEWVDKSAVFKTDLSKLIDNLIQITTDVRKVTDKAHSPEGEKTLKLLHELLFRLEPLDAEHISNFLQKEGVRVHMF